MEIAEVKKPGEATQLDFFQQPISLGRDTFTGGRIQNQTIEDCVEVLRGFRKTLDEYQITDASRIKAMATKKLE